MVMQKILHLIENNTRKYLGVNRHLGGESHAVCNLLSNGLEKNNLKLFALLLLLPLG